MVESDQTSMPVFKKQCTGCLSYKVITEFRKNRTRPDGHEYECRECRAEAQRQYYYLRGGRERIAWYQQQPHIKQRRKEQANTEERRGAQRMYWLSDRGINKVKQWRESEEGKLWWHNYITSGRSLERVHRIKKEGGFRGDISDFYPAHRFLKALETAEVVDIKL